MTTGADSVPSRPASSSAVMVAPAPSSSTPSPPRRRPLIIPPWVSRKADDPGPGIRAVREDLRCERARRRRRVHHPLFARLSARLAASGEAAGAAEHRRELLDGLGGRVVEVGAGPGTNFTHYPPTVRQVVAVEPEGYLRELARRAVASSAVPVPPVAGTTAALPLSDGWADAVVFSLVLCTVGSRRRPWPKQARPVPRRRAPLLQHVRAEGEPDRTAARTSPTGRRRGSPEAAAPNRDTVAAVAAAGFAVTGLRRFDFVPPRAAPGGAPRHRKGRPGRLSPPARLPPGRPVPAGRVASPCRRADASGVAPRTGAPHPATTSWEAAVFT